MLGLNKQLGCYWFSICSYGVGVLGLFGPDTRARCELRITVLTGAESWLVDAKVDSKMMG